MAQEQYIKPIPSELDTFKALLRADLTIQWRNRRAMIMSVIVPLIFLVSWKSLIPEIGGDGVLAICTSIGLPAIGLMGYSMTLARDRERGVFQRLRAAPIGTWAIMTSRITVQLIVMAAMTLITCIAGYLIDGIAVSPLSVVLVVIAAVIGGASFLALGQLIAAIMKSSEAVNAGARLIYFPIAIIGALGEIDLFGKTVQQIVVWSPLGTTKALIAAALAPSTIDGTVLLAFLVTIGYAVVFAAIGISRFSWSVR
jgi:ABC-2 type transport system permease protein